jgi:ascorbate-specific PTS system EIIC-type component UlaA
MMENLHGLIVLVGFIALLVGLTLAVSGPVAAMVGGVLVMALGSWRYVRR